MFEWFKKQYPKSSFTEINAAIGGTGSDFGVFRLNDHVLKFKPDLVFVEFAVNDGGTPEEKIIRSMEGIVRQIWQQNPKTDICFVYTLKDSFLEPARQGQMPTSALTMEKVADHYKIPSINFAVEVSKMVFANQLFLKDASKEINGIKVFSPDGVHPYPETGHVIYQGAIARSFETMGAVNRFKPIKHKLLKPIAKDYFSNTKMLNLNQVHLSKNWQILKIKDQSGFTGFGKYLEEFGKAGQTGETLTFNFKGKAIGAYDIMGPDAGRVIVQIDGIVKDTISRFDAYCTYRRMNYFLIDHLEDKNHEVVFKVLAEPFDKSIILKKRNEVMKNPSDFIENNWYIGKILLDGVLNHFK
ncbi:MAG: SGNH/GDSL hydrolase family protein [Mariniphaga sp.]